MGGGVADTRHLALFELMETLFLLLDSIYLIYDASLSHLGGFQLWLPAKKGKAVNSCPHHNSL
jgi:hypothetical protein